MVTSSTKHNQTILDALIDYAHDAPQDVDAAMFSAFAWSKERGGDFVASELVDTRPVENPAALENFTAIPHVHSTVGVTNMADLAVEMQDSYINGLRESFWTATFQASREMPQVVLGVWLEEIEKINEVEGVGRVLIYQAISTDVVARFAGNGGDCPAIEPCEGPLILINIAVWWKNAADDELVLGSCEERY